MKLLLDTHALLWSMDDESRLGATAHSLISDPANEVFVSIASLWEIVIKTSIDKLKGDIRSIDAAIDSQGFSRLDITLPHLQALALLPLYHRDPFDRMLIAQAQAEQLTFITDDGHAPLYPVTILPCAA